MNAWQSDNCNYNAITERLQFNRWVIAYERFWRTRKQKSNDFNLNRQFWRTPKKKSTDYNAIGLERRRIEGQRSEQHEAVWAMATSVFTILHKITQSQLPSLGFNHEQSQIKLKFIIINRTKNGKHRSRATFIGAGSWNQSESKRSDRLPTCWGKLEEPPSTVMKNNI